MSKLDLLKEYKSYYNAGKNPEIVEFDEANLYIIATFGEFKNHQTKYDQIENSTI